MIGIMSIALIDAALKYLAVTSFPIDSDPSLSPLLALALHKNPGVTFDLAIPLFIIAPVTTAILIGVARLIARLHQSQPIVTLGLISIFAGAANNLIDRLINGFTTDYVMLFRTSVINLSDALIILGVLIILVYYKINPQRT
jgi:signal peptidase II